MPTDPDRRTDPPGAGLVEAKTVGAAVEVFLSPRVVDEGAFLEYARLLRELIGETDRAARGLREALREAGESRAEFDRVKVEQIERLRAASKVLRAIDAATNRTRDTPRAEPAPAAPAPAARPEATERAIHAAERRLALAARTAMTELDRRAREHQRTLAARATDVGAALHAVRRSERAAGEALAEARALASRAAEQGRSLASLHDRVVAALARLEEAPAPATIEHGAETARDLAALLEQAGQVRSAIGEAITESAGLLDEIHERRKRLAGAVRDAVLACEKAEAVARITTARRVRGEE